MYQPLIKFHPYPAIITQVLRIFVDGENLLAQRYEINAGFPMPRATVLGGLDMHF